MRYQISAVSISISIGVGVGIVIVITENTPFCTTRGNLHLIPPLLFLHPFLFWLGSKACLWLHFSTSLQLSSLVPKMGVHVQRRVWALLLLLRTCMVTGMGIRVGIGLRLFLHWSVSQSILKYGLLAFGSVENGGCELRLRPRDSGLKNRICSENFECFCLMILGVG